MRRAVFGYIPPIESTLLGFHRPIFMTAAGFDFIGEVLRTSRYVVSRAISRPDGRRVLLKESTSLPAIPHGSLQRELELIQRLPLKGVPRAVEVATHSGREVLVLEDRGLSPLSRRLESESLPLEEFFAIAIGLCDTLAELHGRDLVLGTLSPMSILVGEGTAEVQFLDFSLAQRVPVDVQPMAASVLAPTTAAYVAPEQTGRISRTVDHRADLYALGATLYEMLAGRPPFESQDALELVHAHIARTPRAPVAVAQSVPEQLSLIVMRLLAKAAEDRYQSADGLRYDLDKCWQEWRDKATVSTFQLGARDFSDRLLIPQRLYGRDVELRQLTSAFEETLEGRPALLLVGGYSGVGKTAFVNELFKPIAREHGYFISGKFDQVARNVPYSALIQAFRSLIWQVLAESEERLAGWRAALTDALGPNGGVVVAVIPEIEFVVGKQPPPVPLEAVESQNRFRYVFRSFIGTFARPAHPLVIFLDDLQWADAATLDLLHPILTDADPRSLLVIGAYRDNEVTADHPLSAAIDRLRHENARVRRLTLESLDEASLLTFLAESLRADESDVRGLATLIRQKTDGNPFFVIQFLQTLQHDGLLSLDRARGQWTFRLESIDAAATTDNVVTLMTQRIQRLSNVGQDVLRLAACIGNPFERRTFLTATSLAGDQAEAGLEQALSAGLIRPAEGQYASEPSSSAAGRGAYAFIHDRVQQAAYALIPDNQRAAVHLGVGRQLLAECGSIVPEDRLFEIVNHLNVGSALVERADERSALARLNLAAGRKAKSSAAYEAALRYLTAGIDSCDEAWWTSDHALVFALHFERAECWYLAGQFDAAADAHSDLLSHAASKLDAAAVHELRVTFYENRSRYAEAIASGRDGLALFGVALPDHDAAVDDALEEELASIERLLVDRSITSLVDLPQMENVEIRTAMRILTLMWAPVYISGNQRLTSLISATMVRLSLAFGNTEDSAYGYVTHAITVGPVRRQFEAAYEWGELAIAVNERFGDTKRRAKIHQQIHAHVKLWRQPFDACVPHAREAARAGLEAGDFAYAGYGAATESWPAFLASRDLSQFVRDYMPALAFLGRVNMSGFRDALRVMLNWALALQGRTSGTVSLSNEYLDEEDFIARYAATAPLFMTILRCAKLHLCVIFDETELGLEAVERARQVTIPGTMWPVLEDFWGALALAAAYETADPDDRARYQSRIDAVAGSLRELADSCPENFRCFSLLVAAERARISGSGSEHALALYEQAVAYAAETGNVQQEALVSDLCGRMLLKLGDTAAAVPHISRAYRAYGSWGALAKVQQMRRRTGQLRPAGVDALDRSEPVASSDDVPALTALDVKSVLKVSRAIAGEIELEGLLRTLLTIAIENAGAECGVFLQVRDDEVVPVIEAIAKNDRVEVRRAEGQDDARVPAQGVVRYVRRTRQDVVIADASTDERFASYAHETGGTRSILCVPVAHQGRLSGILYLEHALSGVFTTARTEIVGVLATQAAIAFENARLYDGMKQEAAQRQRAEEMLRAVTEGTASATGREFFEPLVRHLAAALEVRYAFVAECRDKSRARAKSLAFWKGEGFGENFEYDLAETPCMNVVDGSVCHYSERVQERFPNDRDLVDLGAVSYLGAPMLDTSGRVIGHLAVLHDRPMPEDRWRTAVLKIFAARAGAELERLRAEEDLRRAMTEVETLKNRLQAENVYLQEEIGTQHNFNEIIGNSPVLLDALRRVERVAPTDSTVLILGETGCGKELFARALHNRSKRNDRPLVKVNCGAIAPGLVESELFGHVKGAFTGAIDKRIGRFELANGGTIFLDEIGELPLDAQVKLLRVLQEQEFEPVGSSRTVRVSVRVIAATNRNLEHAVSEGKFRADLLYRLNVFPIEIPPLRERTSDISLLVSFFLSRIARTLGKPLQGVTTRSMEQIQAYSWPGNVRELQNILERAAILAEGPIVSIEEALAGRGSTTVLEVRAQEKAGANLDDVQRDHILSVLASTGGIVEGSRGAAVILGVHPNTLRSRMKKLGIRPGGRTS
jgi:predicted ATPase/transcriptional regulator with GAF, ATPase, and Fis domain